jgi:hypothetical protein
MYSLYVDATVGLAGTYGVCACVDLCDVFRLFYFILFHFTGYIFFSFSPFTLFCAVHFCLLMSTHTKQILLGQRFTDLSCSPFSCIRTALLARIVITRGQRQKVDCFET